MQSKGSLQSTSPSLDHESQNMHSVLSCHRGGFGTYRTDGLGLVANDGDRTYVANLTEGQWTAYSVMTHEALYDISLEVGKTVNLH